jgi:hypothetical protein
MCSAKKTPANQGVSFVDYSPHLANEIIRRNWHLPLRHCKGGCRASQGRFPPPLLMRAAIACCTYAIVRVRFLTCCKYTRETVRMSRLEIIGGAFHFFADRRETRTGLRWGKSAGRWAGCDKSNPYRTALGQEYRQVAGCDKSNPYRTALGQEYMRPA